MLLIKNALVVIDMQFFGSPNFDKQTTAGVRKSIRSLQKRIEEHQKKKMTLQAEEVSPILKSAI